MLTRTGGRSTPRMLNRTNERGTIVNLNADANTRKIEC